MGVSYSDRWLPLPAAARILGRTTDYVAALVDDGTLKAADTARAGAKRRRLSVAWRLARPRPADGKGLTLEEFMDERGL
jgi:hypothetical protein